jgi:hypothetical protein
VNIFNVLLAHLSRGRVNVASQIQNSPDWRNQNWARGAQGQSFSVVQPSWWSDCNTTGVQIRLLLHQIPRLFNRIPHTSRDCLLINRRNFNEVVVIGDKRISCKRSYQYPKTLLSDLEWSLFCGPDAWSSILRSVRTRRCYGTIEIVTKIDELCSLCWRIQ